MQINAQQTAEPVEVGPAELASLPTAPLAGPHCLVHQAKGKAFFRLPVSLIIMWTQESNFTFHILNSQGIIFKTHFPKPHFKNQG